MYLSRLILQNFRSYNQKTFQFSPETNLIIGPNGSGKTNLLEAIFFLSSGKSFRSTSLSQLINWQQSFTSIRGLINNESWPEVQLIKKTDPSGLNRKFIIDQVVKPRARYLGYLKSVIFEPEDIRLVSSSPNRRREYLDGVFTTTEWRYATALSQYHRALQHRNELLDQIRLGQNHRSELYYWDQSLIKNADIIQDYRQKFINSVNNFLFSHPNPEIKQISLNYHSSNINFDRLNQSYPADLERGFTQFGPHRDDFSFNNSIFSAPDKNLAFWGSRGQQRLAVLALRLAQINYLEEVYRQKPLLLLDDIFSELDPDHRQLVVNICNHYQTFFTASEAKIASILPAAQIQNL